MTIATFVFVLPFLLFSHAAGVLADRFSKRNIIILAKYLELIVMIGGCVAIMSQSAASAPILYAMIFLMCTQSTIFGPSKYGIIPELVPREDLSRANSALVALTYLAIILGTFLPSLIVKNLFPKNYVALALFCVIIAGAGIISSLKIAKTDAMANRRPFTPFFLIDIFKTLRRISDDRHLFLAVIGSAYFLFLGAFIKLNILLYGQQCLGFDMETSGYLFPIAALGIGIGALIAGRASGRNIEFGIVPLGAIGLTLCCIFLSFIPANVLVALAFIFFIGVSSGLFIVPLNSFVQYQSPPGNRGEIIASQNFVSFLGVALAAALLKLLTTGLGISAAGSFLIIGLLTAILALCAIIILPDFLIRFVIITIARCLYKIKTIGLSNVPAEGPALLVPNHVTWVDALLIAATQQRRIRFIMSRDVYLTKWLNPLFRLMKVIPVSQDDTPRRVVSALKEARAALDDGQLVCIFAEGAITRNGNIRAFKSGLERIVRNSNHPVIPVYIGGAWGSIFSYSHGKLLRKWPESIPYRISIIFGSPLKSDSSAVEVRQAVIELSGTYFDEKKARHHLLPHVFIHSARRSWFRHALSDTTGKTLSFGGTLTASIALAREILHVDREQKHIGILLPTCVGAALSNIAANLLGKVPVNINFTASRQSIMSAVEQCQIKTILSSRAFMEKMENMEHLQNVVFIEDLFARITPARKISALMKAVFAPADALAAHKHSGPDDTATIIFSSGSTGEPKGVVLSHYNIISNIEGFRQVFHFHKGDRMCGILPFFHSFGYTATLWCPLLTGFSVAYHPNPIDGAKVAEIISGKRLTTLLATPTFLLSYIRRAEREHFSTLRAVIVGAEKLKKRIADSFEEKFGIRPLEGYGATELSPVGSVNIPDVSIDGIHQTGTKEGSIGHPIPGVAMKVVHHETGADVSHGTEGLLMVKGPNVMQGYLNNPEKTAEVLKNGWYNTGDIAKIDSDGFVYLLDRISRYSKIGGEMVPHVAIEDIINHALGLVNPAAFVTSVPDEKKGEQLVVLYTDESGGSERINKIIEESDLPNLWRPKHNNYFRIESIPILGSGKLDIKCLKEFAHNFTGTGISRET